MKDKFIKLINDIREDFNSSPKIRTLDCPSDEDLFNLCFEEDEKRPLINKHLSHIILCPYCVNYISEVIKDKLSNSNSIARLKKELFPLLREIDWDSTTSLELFKNDSSIKKQENIQDVMQTEFEISEPGYYKLINNFKQVIWRREIIEKELFLSDEEYHTVLSFELAAAKDEINSKVILGFEEVLWSGKLQLKMIKRKSKGILKINIDMD